MIKRATAVFAIFCWLLCQVAPIQAQGVVESAPPIRLHLLFESWYYLDDPAPLSFPSIAGGLSLERQGVTDIRWPYKGWWQPGKAFETPKKNLAVDRSAFDRLYNAPQVDEKTQLRREWQQAFGIDVWLPYYKAKEVEGWVKQRFTVKIHHFKGEPQFERNRVLYVFKNRF